MDKKKIAKTLLFSLVLGASTMTMVACNTVEGAGKDTKAAGQKVQDAADAAK